VIRQGVEPAPAGVLAYAAAGLSDDARLALRGSVAGAAQQATRPVVPRKPPLYAARLDRTNFTLMTQPVLVSHAVAAKDLGMRPGLRAAVKADSRAWALTAQVQVASEFGPVLVSDLRTDAFTGAAVPSFPAAGLAQDSQGRIGMAALIER
jgi:hypothetical protein